MDRERYGTGRFPQRPRGHPHDRAGVLLKAPGRRRHTMTPVQPFPARPDAPRGLRGSSRGHLEPGVLARAIPTTLPTPKTIL
jgi:hypothetical protein